MFPTLPMKQNNRTKEGVWECVFYSPLFNAVVLMEDQLHAGCVPSEDLLLFDEIKTHVAQFIYDRIIEGQIAA